MEKDVFLFVDIEINETVPDECVKEVTKGMYTMHGESTNMLIVSRMIVLM